MGFPPAEAATDTNCPKDHVYEPGIVQKDTGTVLPFRDLLNALYGRADFLFIGDTVSDHGDMRVPRFLAKPEPMSWLADNNVRHFFVEMPNSLQAYADELAAGRASRADFIQRMLNAGYYAFAEDTTMDILGMTADTIIAASRKNIRVHFADFDNGKNEYFAFMDAVKEAKGIRTGAAWKKAGEAELAFNKARLDDRKMAAFVNKVMAKNEKAVLFFGATHGARFNDFEEFLNMSSIRLDVYPDDRSYTFMIRSLRQMPDPMIEALRIGEDKPELVYKLHEGRYYRTCNTPSTLLPGPGGAETGQTIKPSL